MLFLTLINTSLAKPAVKELCLVTFECAMITSLSRAFRIPNAFIALQGSSVFWDGVILNLRLLSIAAQYWRKWVLHQSMAVWIVVHVSRTATEACVFLHFLKVMSGVVSLHKFCRKPPGCAEATPSHTKGKCNFIPLLQIPAGKTESRRISDQTLILLLLACETTEILTHDY